MVSNQKSVVLMEEREGSENILDTDELGEIHSEINHTLVELKKLLQVADILSVQTEREKGKKVIKYAVDVAEEGRYGEALNALKESRDFLKDLIDKRLEEEVKNLSSFINHLDEKKKVRKVKCIVSRIEDIREEEKYEEMLELVFKARDGIEEY